MWETEDKRPFSHFISPVIGALKASFLHQSPQWLGKYDKCDEAVSSLQQSLRQHRVSTRSVLTALTPSPGPGRAVWFQDASKSLGHSKCFANGTECKGVYIEIAKRSLFSQKGLLGDDFHFLLWPFIHFFPDILTWTFITFIIIYWKISCIKMKSPQKTLRPLSLSGYIFILKNT